MAFPPAGAEIYRNEAGEPTGWDAHPDYDGTAFYHDLCGTTHPDGKCPDEDFDDLEGDDDLETPVAYDE